MTDNSYDTWMYAVALSDDSTYIMLEWGLVLLVGAAAFVIALNKGLRIWDWKIFRAPLGLVLLVWAYFAEPAEPRAGCMECDQRTFRIGFFARRNPA